MKILNIKIIIFDLNYNKYKYNNVLRNYGVSLFLRDDNLKDNHNIKDKEEVLLKNESTKDLQFDISISNPSVPEFKDVKKEDFSKLLTKDLLDIKNSDDDNYTSEEDLNLKVSKISKISNTEERVTHDVSYSIIDDDVSNKIDFIMMSDYSQTEPNIIFNFSIQQYSKITIPDVKLTHIKSPANREVLINIQYLSFKLNIWDKIYKFYFKSIFKVISKLNPIDNKYFKDLNAILVSQDSLRSTPAMNMLFNYRDSVSKIVYGYSNGLQDLMPFLVNKYHKVNIDYRLDSGKGGMSYHKTVITWFTMLDNEECKYSVTVENLDLSYNHVSVQTPFNNLRNNSIYNNNSVKGILSSIYTMSTDNVKIDPIQYSTSTRHTINYQNTADPGTSINTQGFVSQMIVNGQVYIDFSNSSLFLSMSSLLGIEHLGIKDRDISDSKSVKEITNYIGSMIYHFAITQVRPANSILRDLSCNITIEKKDNFRDEVSNHDLYVNRVRSGDIIPIAPVHFDYYFYKSTLLKFSEYIVLSAMSNITINSELHSVLPKTNDNTKINFNNYAKNRSLLHSKTYLPNNIFEFQNNDYHIIFDQLIVEMYVRLMLFTKVPDYIPLITRGDWGHGDNRSLTINTPYINNNFVKFTMINSHCKITKFVSDILCVSNDFRLDPVFKRTTRLTDNCPDIFNRFVFLEDYSQADSDSNIGVHTSYLEQNNLDE